MLDGDELSFRNREVSTLALEDGAMVQKLIGLAIEASASMSWKSLEDKSVNT